MKQRMPQTLATVLFTLAVCLTGDAFNNPVLACECYKRNDFEQEFSFSKAILVGEVVEIDQSKPDAIVTFKVEKMWKGAKSETIVVRTNNQGKTCGFIFTRGEKYLVYAYEEGALRTSICTRTREVKSAAEDLKELTQKKEL